MTECLKDTVNRFLPYWHETIAPAVTRGERVLITAHGNSLRALVKFLDGISDEAIVRAQHPDGHPARLRARSRPAADPQHVPRRSRSCKESRGTRGGADEGIGRKNGGRREVGGGDCREMTRCSAVLRCASRPAPDEPNRSGQPPAARGLVHFLRRSIRRDPERPKKPPIVGGDVERALRGAAIARASRSWPPAPSFSRLMNPTTASRETRISYPAARARSRHASTCGFSATAAAMASASSRANRLTSSICVFSLPRAFASTHGPRLTSGADRALRGPSRVNRDKPKTGIILRSRLIRVKKRSDATGAVPSLPLECASNASAKGIGRHAPSVHFARQSRERRRRRRPRLAWRVPVHPRHPAHDVPRPPLDDAPVRGFRDRRRVEPTLPLPAGSRRQRAQRGIRPAHADGIRLRSPAGRRRGGAGRRGDRLARGHGGALRRDPARPRLHVDDDQRHRHHPARALRGGGPPPARAARDARRHGPERHPEGVHRARHLHLPAPRLDADRHRHLRVLRARAAAMEHDLDQRVPHPRGRIDGRAGDRLHARQRDRLRGRSPRRRARRERSSGSGSRSSSTATTTSSRRSRSSAPRGGCGRA